VLEEDQEAIYSFLAMPFETVETLEPSKIPMTQDTALNGIPPQSLQAIPSGRQISIESQLRRRSGIRGRERWHVSGLKGNQRLAATLEMALRGESGVTEAVANPLTGCILVRYSQVQASVEILIRSALTLKHPIESEVLQPVASKRYSLPARLLTAELGCSLLKFLLLGGASAPIRGIVWAAGIIVVLAFRGSVSSWG
jgi:ATP-binding cassette, subfamily B, bacterial